MLCILQCSVLALCFHFHMTHPPFSLACFPSSLGSLPWTLYPRTPSPVPPLQTDLASEWIWSQFLCISSVCRGLFVAVKAWKLKIFNSRYLLCCLDEWFTARVSFLLWQSTACVSMLTFICSWPPVWPFCWLIVFPQTLYAVFLCCAAVKQDTNKTI